MSDAPLSRRLVLRGLGGAALALPTLPSLFSASEARAADAANQRCFVHFMTEHGSVNVANMFPAHVSAPDRVTHGGHTVRRSPLPTFSGATSKVSNVLQAPSGVLTSELAAKMNVLAGIDIPFDIAHYRGGVLGNYAANNGDNSHSQKVRDTVSSRRRTIDQVMAWSPEFYGAAAGVAQRSITCATPDPYANCHLSYGYSNPADPASGPANVAPVRGTVDSWTVFSRLFPSVGNTPSARAPIVDRVLEQYKALRNGNRRLSAADKLRLDEYIQRVAEIQRRLSTPSNAACAEQTRPAVNSTSLGGAGFATNAAEHAHFYQLLTDVLLTGLMCGRTRIATLCLISYDHSFSTEVAGSTWHDAVAHPASDNGTAQTRMVAAQTRFFRDVLVRFVDQLNQVDMGDGKKLLDKSLVVWAQEHGNLTHQTTSVPLVTFGSADGRLRTGSFLDYRNMERAIRGTGQPGEVGQQRLGLTMNQFLGNTLQAMGVPASAYAESNHGGYGYRPTGVDLGDNQNNLTTEQGYPEAVWRVAGQTLPWFGA